MSGYGGQPGWQDPYDPYAQQQPPAYGQPQGGWQDPYAYGPPGVPRAPASNGSAIGALVCNIILTVLCCGLLAIPGIVTSAMAMGRTQSDPESARNLAKWSWVIFGINLMLMAAVLIILIVIGANNSNSGSTTTY